ncbi:MAG: exodeoxyribonuclease VII large subunit [Thermoanaerobaculia bacterium]
MPASRHVYTVSALIDEVNEMLDAFRDLYVEGEVTNFTRSAPGHLYFTIKDAKAQISVAMFAMSARGVRFKLENGLKVIVRGRLKIYEARGSFQIVAESVEPVGVGALQLAFEQLKARLAAEGLFDAERKKPIPMLPQRIAIVTSPTGAAIRDILNVLGRRFDSLHIQIYPVRVQGATAASEIATAIRNLSRWNLHDVVLICRGGGSLEDLWSFNEEVVARAVAACRIPTISGVGHEVDFSICDFVADLRAPTPSAAAEIVIGRKDEICERIDGGVRRIRQVVEGRVRNLRHELRHLASADGIGRVERRVRLLREQMQRRQLSLYRLLDAHARAIRTRLTKADDVLGRLPVRLGVKERKRYVALLSERAARALSVRSERHRARLKSLVATLEAVSPLSVLTRGYAIAFTRRGGRLHPLLDSGAVRIGDPIEVQLKKGRLECTVDRSTMGLETLWPEMSRPAAQTEDEEDDGPTPRQ